MNSNPGGVKSDGIFSTRRLGLAGLAGIAACAACCSVPLLVAAGVGGGALTGLAAYVQPGAELVVGLGAAGLVLGMAAVRSRRRSAGCGDACSVPASVQVTGSEPESSDVASCGCGPTTGKKTSVFRSPAPGPDEPIVCTADFADKPTVQGLIDGYRAAFAHLVRTEQFPGGFRWVFRTAPGLEVHLKWLAENEHQCCRFFSFDVVTTSEQIFWEIRAHDEAASVLESFSQLPERLKEEPRRGADVAMLERRSGEAGLRFAADREQSH
jgi:mercuric ion transport protein